MVSWKAGVHSAPMGCISSINSVVVYRFCNVAARDHKKDPRIRDFAAVCGLIIYVKAFAL